MRTIALDKTDKKILAVLQADGRVTNAELAQRVNLSASACLRRVQNQSEESLRTFERAANACPEIMECYLMAGDADYLIRVVAANSEDYERIHRQHLTVLPGVARIRSSFALRAVCKKTALDF